MASEPAGFFLYASFPNSRNKARNPTTDAITDVLTIGNNTEPMTLISVANANRTYLVLSNEDPATNLRYVYPLTIPGFDPTTTPLFGVIRQVMYDSTGNILYQKQDTGNNTNWTIVSPSAVAEFVLPFQNATLDTLGDVYGFADAASGSIQIAIDEGRG